MTNNLNNINRFPTTNHSFQLVEINTIKKHFNKSNKAKLLLLNLDDLNADIIEQLKAKQCKMIWLNDDFKIVEQTKSKFIELNIDGCKQSVAIENIIRFEACGNYTYIYFSNKKEPVLTSKTLKHYEDLVGEENFIRTHSKHLINSGYVTGFKNGKSVSLAGSGVSVPVSRRRVSYVKSVLLNG